LLFFIGITVAGAAHDDGDGDDDDTTTIVVVVGERIVVGLFDEDDDVEDLGERCSPLLFLLLPILSPPTPPPRGVGKDEEDVVEGPPIFFFFSLSLTLCLCLFSRARRTSKRGPSSRSLCALRVVQRAVKFSANRERKNSLPKP